jgi:hypothetical protein
MNFSPMKNEEDSEDVPSQPACIACRNKKQKCSRGNPCRSCLVSGSQCFYIERKPRGARPGHYENIIKRLDHLESIVIGQSMMFSTRYALPDSGSALPPTMDQVTDRVTNTLEMNYSRAVSGQKRSQESITDNNDEGHTTKLRKQSFEYDIDNFLPPDDLLQEVCIHYFREIHPWIPILHEKTFRPTILSHDRTTIILQAITAVSVKFTTLPFDLQDMYYQKCRRAVVLASMDRFSLETLQANIIIAYDTIGSGKGPRSWSIISSATRIVEQLGLAEEEDEMDKDKLLNRIGLLQPSKSLAEKESRRRLFWSIFQMDRFCSVVTGWNTSLTSTDVRRLLPVEGHYFRNSISKRTRYFNISDHEVDSTDENDALGGYAYCIEAVECLSRVASFLLKERVVFTSSDGIKAWFNRFQALDSMLVRWKMFLPAKWQHASIQFDGKLDENLTLAHVTHNTSVVLLHHNIAYPPPELNITLPSQSSAQTCIAAATEITTIMSNFLANLPGEVSPQFSFLLFVAARTFLTDSLRNNTPLSPNFESLLSSIKEISRRWCANGSRTDNLAKKFALRLEMARNMKSPIDSKATVFQEEEDGGLMSSLASPPIADVFNSNFLEEAIRGEMIANSKRSNSETSIFDVDPSSNELDLIFTWQGSESKATDNK